MSELENVRQIEQVFAAFGRGDLPAILAQLTDDVHWISHLESIVPWSGDYSGKANVPKFFGALGGSVDVSAHPVHQLVAQGDTVVALGGVSFRVRSTGKTGQSSWVYVWKLRDGRIYRYDQFNDPGLANAFR
jgi:ketosteroid isomerase-like protein